MARELDLTLVGGKAASLVWLRKHGFPTPPFDVIGRDRIADALTTGRFRSLARDLDRASDEFAVSALAHALKREVAEVVRASPELAEALASALCSVQTPLVAMRSSGATEDGTSHSFAGQYSTLFIARQEPDVSIALARVISSFYNLRAVLYRRIMAVPISDFDLAVIVQDFVYPLAAGVAFSSDPTGSTDHVLVEAVPGIGSQLVDGASRPHRWYFDASSRKLLSGQISTSLAPARISAEFDGGLPTKLEYEQAVNAHLTALVDDVLAIRKLAGHEVDIEWAILPDSTGAGRRTFLQVRPVTRTVTDSRNTPPLLRQGLY